MAQQWLEQIADNIKRRHHEAAEDYGRAQHYAGIIADRGKPFFLGLVQCLQQNVDALRAQLQGDMTAAETALQTVRACEVKIIRSRFPWVDATVEHHTDTITLDYARSNGTAGDPAQDRILRTYAFRVDSTDRLYLEDAFTERPAEYRDPEALARHITEVLFAS